jgi:arsenate reductase-like glutaredoxin family protein
VTCGKTQGFLADRKLVAAEEVNAKKNTLGEKDALKLAREADVIYAARGKRVVRIDLKKDKPDDATLKSVMLGPTGNLRAPTLRKGKTLIVGFDEETYEKLLL